MSPMSVNRSDGVLVFDLWGSGILLGLRLLGAGKTGKGRSGWKGRLLSGHAGSGSGVARAPGRSIEGQHLGAAAD